MSEPLVTVYITNHNYARYLRQSIESVLGQKFTDFELIIIDDGSTDGSLEILTEYERHPQVRIVSQENHGLTVANNIALDRKSTRLNSSHSSISYAVFCLKKK